MGSLLGHIFPGISFIFIGVWHLFNHSKLHALRPDSFCGHLWFPTPKIRYLELYLIMLGSSDLIAVELYFTPRWHRAFDTDGSIPSNHLHKFEHSLIGASFFIYALFSILLDKAKTHADHVRSGLVQLVGAVAFGLELLIFHFHSTDHVGVESQYHLMFQIIISISITTTLIGIAWPKSFLVSFVRSVSILFQGVWLVVTGVMLYIPTVCPKGCYLKMEKGHYVMHCDSDEALHRAIALVNIEFSWYVIVIVTFSVAFYLAVEKGYSTGGQKMNSNYRLIMKEVELNKEVSDDQRASVLMKEGMKPSY